MFVSSVKPSTCQMSESNCVADGEGTKPAPRKLLKFSEPTVTGLVEVVEESQLSVAVAEPVADGSVEAVHSTVTLAGAVTTGAVVSVASMVCWQLAVLPQASVAVHVRVMIVFCGQLPGATLSL